VVDEDRDGVPSVPHLKLMMLRAGSVRSTEYLVGVSYSWGVDARVMKPPRQRGLAGILRIIGVNVREYGVLSSSYYSVRTPYYVVRRWYLYCWSDTSSCATTAH
jgi:hypothetical protein